MLDLFIRCPGAGARFVDGSPVFLFTIAFCYVKKMLCWTVFTGLKSKKDGCQRPFILSCYNY